MKTVQHLRVCIPVVLNPAMYNKSIPAQHWRVNRLLTTRDYGTDKRLCYRQTITAPSVSTAARTVLHSYCTAHYGLHGFTRRRDRITPFTIIHDTPTRENKTTSARPSAGENDDHLPCPAPRRSRCSRPSCPTSPHLRQARSECAAGWAVAVTDTRFSEKGLLQGVSLGKSGKRNMDRHVLIVPTNEPGQQTAY